MVRLDIVTAVVCLVPLLAAGHGDCAVTSNGNIGVDWEDPEPAGAQELAERVVGAAWNEDKTTRLTMRITTLVDRTTGLSGFGSRLDRGEASLEERLGRLGATETETELTIRLAGAVLFDFDSAVLRPDAETRLREVAGVLTDLSERPVRVEGHTDAIASKTYNQALSERRAAAVSEWLVAHGIAAERLSSLGHGELQPVADNSTPQGRQLNRRVEVIVEK
jgi:outer membrane protein OmpA-like peptidoglycan-associated protein